MSKKSGLSILRNIPKLSPWGSKVGISAPHLKKKRFPMLGKDTGFKEVR